MLFFKFLKVRVYFFRLSKINFPRLNLNKTQINTPPLAFFKNYLLVFFKAQTQDYLLVGCYTKSTTSFIYIVLGLVVPAHINSWINDGRECFLFTRMNVLKI